MITQELFLELGELMAFRHFYRHAYMMRLRWDRIQPLVKKLAYVPKAFARDEAQIINYLKLSRLPVGYLRNFANPRVEWKRFVNQRD